MKAPLGQARFWGINFGLWRWCIAPGAPEGILEHIYPCLQPGSGTGLRAISRSRVREVAWLDIPGQDLLVLKHYLPLKRPKAVWMALRGTQWRREWEMGHMLRTLGLSVPEPFFLGERVEWGLPVEGVLVTRAIKGGQTISRALSSGQACRSALLKKMGCLVARLHGLGILHKDLHAENVLVSFKEKGDVQFWLLDLHRMRISKRLSHKKRQWNLAQLLFSLRQNLEPGEDKNIVQAYLRESGLVRDQASWARALEQTQKSMGRRHARSRTRRCLKESTGFAVHKIPGARVIRRRDFPLEGVLWIMERVTGSECERVLKLDGPIRVTVHSNPMKSPVPMLCVKEYRRYCPLGVPFPARWASRPRRFWMGAWGLIVRGFSVPAPLAIWEGRGHGRTSSGVVMEMVEDGVRLDRFLGSLRERGVRVRVLIAPLASTLSRMHRSGVFHRDLNAANILVRPRREGLETIFLDLEDVRFQRRVSQGQMAVNLAQLDASVPDSVGKFSRLRFLCLYGKGWVNKEALKLIGKKAGVISQLRREGSK